MFLKKLFGRHRKPKPTEEVVPKHEVVEVPQKTVRKEILISKEANEVRVAYLEEGQLEEFNIERLADERLLGNIYKGKVKSIVSGIRAAFVDIGSSRDGFLYVGDALRSPLDEDGESSDQKPPQRRPSRGRGGRNRKPSTAGRGPFTKDKSIEDIVKIGQEVVVQVVKEPIRGKGPRLTTKFTVPARYLVLMPGEKKVGISRRISDRKERDRLRKIFQDIKLPKDAGFIMRTAAEGKRKEDFIRDVRYLENQWARVKNELQKKRVPATIHRELDLVERTVRDFITEDIGRIMVDDQAMLSKLRKFIKLYLPDVRIDTRLYEGKLPLFEKYEIEKVIDKAFRKKVELKSGGHLVIEQTEGLVSIDVNTGKFQGKGDLEHTAYLTNLEAVPVIARQLRLRDLGGIIVVDFIDMEKIEHRREVTRTFREVARKDKAKTNILALSDLGLLEMTRQRVRPSLEGSVYETCHYCQGKGMVKSASTMAIETIKGIMKVIGGNKNKTLQVSVHPGVAEHITRNDSQLIADLEKKTENKILIVADPNCHTEGMNWEMTD